MILPICNLNLDIIAHILYLKEHLNNIILCAAPYTA